MRGHVMATATTYHIGYYLDWHALRPRGAQVRFRSLDTLARRLGGRTAYWRTEHDDIWESPVCTVHVLRPNRRAGATEVVARVRVDRATVIASRAPAGVPLGDPSPFEAFAGLAGGTPPETGA